MKKLIKFFQQSRFNSPECSQPVLDLPPGSGHQWPPTHLINEETTCLMQRQQHQGKVDQPSLIVFYIFATRWSEWEEEHDIIRHHQSSLRPEVGSRRRGVSLELSNDDKNLYHSYPFISIKSLSSGIINMNPYNGELLLVTSQDGLAIIRS